MNDFALMLSGLAQKKIRTILISFSILIAFFIFVVLSAFQTSLSGTSDTGIENRLVVMNKISPTQSLPVAYNQRLQTLPGIQDVSYFQWFGGYYQDQKATITTYAVDPESFVRINSDLSLPSEQVEAFLNQRDSVMIGRALADANGWGLGQRLPLSSNIWRREDGGYTWSVIVRAIFEEPVTGISDDWAFVHFAYFDDARAFAKDHVSTFLLETVDASQNPQIIQSIELEFQNSHAEVKAVTQAAYAASFINQTADFGAVLIGVTLASFFSILLITATAMAGAIAERSNEIAVLKTLGFTSPRIGRIVVGETLLLTIIGGGLGIGAAWFAVDALRNADQFFSTMTITPMTLASTFAMVVGLGISAAAIPALNAMRIDVISVFQKD